jgi:hypothetical protein
MSTSPSAAVVNQAIQLIGQDTPLVPGVTASFVYYND